MERYFRLLLLIWPGEFRRRFGDEMTASFRSELDDARRRGTLRSLWFMARATVGTVVAGVAESLGMRGSGKGEGGMRISDFMKDLRVAFRALVKEPGFSVSAIVALGLGIGLTAAAFSVVWGTLLRGLPFENAEELVHFERANEEFQSLAVTPHDFTDWQEQQRSFDGLAAYTEALVTLETAGGFAERVEGSRIQASAFGLLGVDAAVGRTITAADDHAAAERVVVLSHALWNRRFNEDPAVVGSAIRLNALPHTVVGVMPPGFQFPLAEEFWIPLRLDLAAVERGQGRLDAFGRLRDGVSLTQARAEFDVISRNIAEAYPGTNTGVSARLNSYIDEYVDDEFNGVILALLFGAILVLIVACLNVANLMLVRGSGRARELALRVSLGAGRTRILQQMLAEATALAIGGAALGVTLAWIGVEWFAGSGSEPGTFQLAHGGAVPFWWDVRLDWVSLSFVLICTLGTVLLAGMVPAIQALRANPNRLLREERRGGTARTGYFSRGVVIGEIAVATAVLSVSGLMAKSVLQLASVGEGIETDNIVTARIPLPDARLGADESAFPTVQSRMLFWQQLTEALRQDPGVRAATLTDAVPFLRSGRTAFGIPGREDEGDSFEAGLAAVDESFFSVIGVTPLAGRLFDSRDGAGSPPVAVVNQSFATRWLGGLATGTQIELDGPTGELESVTVVGIVPDSWMQGIRNEVPEGIYRPVWQAAGVNRTDRFDRRELRYLSLMVQGTANASPAETIRRLSSEMAPGVPVYGIETLEGIRERVGGQYRLYGTFYLVFGAAALFMVLLGLYGLIAYSVGQRTREVGIRVALGAAAATVLTMIMRGAMVQVGIGLAAGAIMTMWLRQSVQLVLYQVDPNDPGVVSGVLALMLATTALAAWIPARRASAIDPVDAIRAE